VHPPWRCLARPVRNGGETCGGENPNGGKRVGKSLRCETCGLPKHVTDQIKAESAEANSSEIARRMTARDLVQEYQAAREEIRQGFALVHAAQERLNRAFYTESNGGRGNAIDVRDDRDRTPRWDNPKDVFEYIEDQAWWAVAERLDMWSCLSPHRAQETRGLLHKGEMPPLTEDAIVSMAKSLHQQLGSLVQECVTEVYAYLRPRDQMYSRGKFKSNSPYRVGKRVVLERVIDTSYSFWHLNYHHEPELKALERVMQMLDGKGTTTPEEGSALVNGIKALRDSHGGSFDTEYFHAKAFKNGNLHLWFKNKDLLLEFNRRAGGTTLAP
jgi:hypothetical protein